MSAHMIKPPLLDHGSTIYPACFRPSSPVGENGFVPSDYCFVGASPTKQVHGIATTLRKSANLGRPEVVSGGPKRNS